MSPVQFGPNQICLAGRRSLAWAEIETSPVEAADEHWRHPRRRPLGTASAPPIDAALASAARYCEAMVTAKRTDLPVPSGATVHSDSGVPDLIRRVAATGMMIRMFGVDSYAHFHARNGQVWVVRPRQADSCNIVVTAVPGGVAVVLRDTFIRSLPGQGWEIRTSLAATATSRSGAIPW